MTGCFFETDAIVPINLRAIKQFGSEAAAAELTLFAYAIHIRGDDNLSFWVQELLKPLAVAGQAEIT